MENRKIPLDYQAISEIIEPGAKVLDLGCGTGDLMHHLVTANNVKAQGIELNEGSIYKCVEKGLSVFHSDIDSGLGSYPDKSFDYIILNQTLQEVKKVDYVIDEALRVAHKVIIGFPNFATLEARFILCFQGRAPVTESLPYRWHNTPNLRFLSIIDFMDFCKEKQLKVLRSFFFNHRRRVTFLPNLFATSVVVVVTQ